MCWEFMCLQLISHNVLNKYSLSTAGGTAGFCYWVGTYPLDAIKGRIQAQPFDQRRSWLSVSILWNYKAFISASSVDSFVPFNTFAKYEQIAKSFITPGGFKEVSKGFIPCAARAGPACAVMFATVDLTRNALSNALN